MPVLNFSKWSPGGNITLLFPVWGLPSAEQAHLAAAALDQSSLGGEQAGFVNLRQKRLRMAGGEFCVNASRALGALLAYADPGCALPQGILDGLDPMEQSDSAGNLRLRLRGGSPAGNKADIPSREDEIQVSGWQTPVRLRTRGAAPCWEVEALLRLPDCPVVSVGEGARLVRLPGISHLLLAVKDHPLPDDCYAAAAQLRRQYGLTAEPAAGVIWWRECQGQLEMLPLVYVRDAGTAYLENACGSGALALALYLAGTGGQRSFSILQPSGTALAVRLFSDGGSAMAGIDGPVSLIAQGRTWLPESGQHTSSAAVLRHDQTTA